MKKNLISFLLIIVFLFPNLILAQSVNVSLNQQLNSLISQTIELIQKLIVQLTEQLNQQEIENSSNGGTATSSSSQIDQKVDEVSQISIENEGLIYKFNDPSLEGKYLADVKLKAKKNILKMTLYYYIYPSDDSTNRVQEYKVFRSIDQDEIIELQNIKYSIEMKDSKDRWVQISEWFDIEEASATSNGKEVKVNF